VERLLSAYRIVPIAPSLSQADAKTRKSRSLLRFRLSFIPAVGSLTVVAISVAFLGLYLNRGKNETTGSPDVTSPNIKADQISEPEIPIGGSANLRSTSVARARRIQSRAHRSPAQLAAAKLTPEEKYAYQQVLVALWITGSKLKVVQDTINRVNDENENSTSEKR
jgi:hypothetical protein